MRSTLSACATRSSLVEIGVGGFAAHDVVDEGAVDAGDLADLRGIETELSAAGLEAVGHGVAHRAFPRIVEIEDQKGLIHPPS